MHLANFLKSDVAKSSLRSALSMLHQANFFSVMLEVAARRNAASNTSVKNIEGMALRSAWVDGYQEAIWDLYYFFERYTEQKDSVDLKPDFGARDFLLNTKSITKDEYEQFGNTATFK